jgi:hypothetical protein
MIISTAALVVNVCSVIVFFAGFAKNWMLARGTLKPVYWLNILMGIAGTALNFGVVAAVPSMWGILSFCLLNIWVVAMGIKGLYRLRQEELCRRATPLPVPPRALMINPLKGPGTMIDFCGWVDDAYACYCEHAPCWRF